MSQLKWAVDVPGTLRGFQVIRDHEPVDEVADWANAPDGVLEAEARRHPKQRPCADEIARRSRAASCAVASTSSPPARTLGTRLNLARYGLGASLRTRASALAGSSVPRIVWQL